MPDSTLKSIVRTLVNPVLAWRHGKKRVAELRLERRYVTREHIVTDLRAMPIREGVPVLVHSSLKSLGFVEGGADTALDAMIEVVVEQRGGTLILPTYSIDGTMANTLRAGRAFDVRNTPSNLGRLPETFRARKDVVRSVHPTHSFGALGPDATYIVGGQLDSDSNFGPDTPMMRLMELNGQLLGLGTHVGRVTLYHCLEDNDTFPFSVYTEDSPFEIEVIDEAGVSHRRAYAAHTGELEYRIDRPNSEALRDFYQAQFECDDALTWHTVCEADCWLIDAERLFEKARRLKDAGLTIYATPKQARRAFRQDHKKC